MGVGAKKLHASEKKKHSVIFYNVLAYVHRKSVKIRISKSLF